MKLRVPLGDGHGTTVNLTIVSITLAVVLLVICCCLGKLLA